VSEAPSKERRRRALTAGLAVAALALAGSTVYLALRGPSRSYVDGYNFAVAFSHGSRHVRVQLSPANADSSCSVWSFSNAGGVPPGDVPRLWRQGCEAALTSGAFSTIAR
jgi:hypothetical protein